MCCITMIVDVSVYIRRAVAPELIFLVQQPFFDTPNNVYIVLMVRYLIDVFTLTICINEHRIVLRKTNGGSKCEKV